MYRYLENDDLVLVLDSGYGDASCGKWPGGGK